MGKDGPGKIPLLLEIAVVLTQNTPDLFASSYEITIVLNVRFCTGLPDKIQMGEELTIPRQGQGVYGIIP